MIFGWVPAVLVAVFPFISQGRVPRTGQNSTCPVRETLIRCLLRVQLQLPISPKWWRNDKFSLDAGNLLVCTLVYHHCCRWLDLSPFQIKTVSFQNSVMYCFYDIMTENDEDVFINTETIQKPVLYASLGLSYIKVKPPEVLPVIKETFFEYILLEFFIQHPVKFVH